MLKQYVLSAICLQIHQGFTFILYVCNKTGLILHIFTTVCETQSCFCLRLRLKTLHLWLLLSETEVIYWKNNQQFDFLRATDGVTAFICMYSCRIDGDSKSLCMDYWLLQSRNADWIVHSPGSCIFKSLALFLSCLHRNCTWRGRENEKKKKKKRDRESELAAGGSHLGLG